MVIYCNLCDYKCEEYDGFYFCNNPECNNEYETDGHDKYMNFYFINVEAKY